LGLTVVSGPELPLHAKSLPAPRGLCYGGLDSRQKVRGRYAQGRSNVDELNDINPSLSVLIFGDEGLRLAQRIGQLRLGQSSGLTRFDEEGLKKYLSRRAQGFLHSGWLSIEKEEPFR
jgi:hypothetical protein